MAIGQEVSNEYRLITLLLDDLISQLGGMTRLDELCATDGLSQPKLLSAMVTGNSVGQKTLRLVLQQVLDLLDTLRVKARVVGTEGLKGRLKTGDFTNVGETVRSAIELRAARVVKQSEIAKLRAQEAEALAEHMRLQTEVRRLQDADTEATRIKVDAQRLLSEAVAAAA